VSVLRKYTPAGKKLTSILFDMELLLKKRITEIRATQIDFRWIDYTRILFLADGRGLKNQIDGD
jgi:hypothetical protein